MFKQFTARDVVSRWDVIQAHGRATAANAAQFLETLLHRMPFPIRALQVDGGSEFAAEFEQACQQRGLRLFVRRPVPPNSTALSNAPTAPTPEEFYQVTPCSLEMKKLNRELCAIGSASTTPFALTKPLDYLTPPNSYPQLSSQRKE